jgi:beta-phosphoglucomutase
MSDGSILGVIFDMDGVLCDSEPFITEAAARMFARVHGVKVEHGDFLPFTGTGEDRFIGGVAEKYGVKLTMPRDKEITYQIYLEIIKGWLKPLPGAVELIGRLGRAGIKMAVATSADRIKMEGNLAELGLSPGHFEAIVTGSEVINKKPNPEIFTTAAMKLGLSNDSALVVEDAVSGVKAGKAAGSPVLGLTTSFEETTLREAGADWVAADLAHVPTDLLARLFPG